MFEVLVYYVLPNVVLFGGIFAISKLIERASWYVIENYETLIEKVK